MSPTAASTSAFIAPTGLAALLAIANGEAEGIGSPIEAGDILKLLDPNHESESRSMELILAAIIPTGIAFAFVLLRLWMRIKTNPRWALDDWLIIPALALGCGSATNTVYGKLWTTAKCDKIITYSNTGAEHAGVGKHAVRSQLGG